MCWRYNQTSSISVSSLHIQTRFLYVSHRIRRLRSLLNFEDLLNIGWTYHLRLFGIVLILLK